MNTDCACTCPEALAIATVPMQDWCEPYDWCTALSEGTIFPCLNLVFHCAPEGTGTAKKSDKGANAEQTEREMLMNKISCVSFAVNDLTLYLDTHPDCPKGTKLFYQLVKERLELLAEFSSKYYPLTQSSMVTGHEDTTRYEWPEGPMPWEGGCI